MGDLTVPLESRTAINGGVKLHYKTAGSGPPILFLHGLPDHALGWRRQLGALAATHQVIAPDLRGFGQSGAPAGIACYALPLLVNDVLAVLAAEKLAQASVVGHDWGATIAWWLAMRVPRAVRHLVVLSAPHPRHYLRAFDDPANAEMVRYIRRFQQPDAVALTTDEMSNWVADPGDRQALKDALGGSGPQAMLNYYKANIPAGRVSDLGPLPPVRAPTLALFGTADPYVPLAAYDGTFREVDNVCSLVAIPGAGHFIHHEAADFVNEQIEAWVSRPPSAYRKSARQPQPGA